VAGTTPWVVIPESSLTSIKISGYGNGYEGSVLGGVEIDGVELVDQGISDPLAANIDSLVDSPTNGDPADDTGLGGELAGNFCTLNPLDKHTNVSLSNGNLNYSSASKPSGVRGTLAVSSGKWYYEYTPTASPYTSAPTQYFGFSDVNASSLPTGSDYIYLTPGFYSITTRGSYIQINGTQSATSWGSFPVGTTMGAALDLDNGTLKIYGGGTLLGTIATGLSGTFAPLVYADTISSGDTATLNFGQRPFKYNNFGVNRPSADYKCLCTANLPEPTIPDGRKFFAPTAYEGTSGTKIVGDLLYSPDFVWVKKRSGGSHFAYDTIRGFSNGNAYELRPSGNNAQGVPGTANSGLTSFNSDGFTLGGDGGANGNGDAFIAWAWDAGANSNRTYTVTVVNSGGNKYRFDGNGDNAVTLDLAEGSTYEFDQSHSSNAGHPLRFGTSANGTNYTTGVTHTGTPGSAGAKTTLVLGSGVSTLYYSCQNHSGMGGQINTNSTEGSTVLRGSANSSLYDQSQTWSGLWTGSVGYGSFVNLHDADDTDYAQSLNASITFSPAISLSSLRIQHSSSFGTATLSINGTNVTSQLATSGTKPFDTITGFTSLTSIAVSGADYSSNVHTLYGIEVNGRKLIDPGVSVANFPSIASTVKASPESGFSIVSWVGNGGIGESVGHGLSAAPEFIMCKCTNSSVRWAVYTKAVGPGNTLVLNTIDNPTGGTGVWGNVYPTSSVFTVSNDSEANGSGNTYVAYCFAPVSGYSAMGSYTGNGSADGSFIYTGFKIAWLLTKRTDGGSNDWQLIDASRSPSNVADDVLKPNNTSAEGTNADYSVDFLSNGFKHRTGHNARNGSGNTYIYLAFASHPFKSSRAR
jgi:hypothetical protein